ncbi:hypothetical protein [Francisella philomiragia]|uniref:hypothetical protein n=1 Tax=Francisella philomiragia TaxID=28110 RepID=UPI00190574CC|nr:hypothetical protein [Francisella philomiragia]MBK2266494.1 hypothetical protein [Francisella philomiragia]MBK2278338.1 hypothetical protein [Francisella philomiragia]MBK2286194.1 hypothetical protein [Francisella philomiragia]MBK2287777.1 hypothetical protein [Francisella philomiragia]MBK2290153.1 hypothetical protein [Francisella philomiragia]
MKLDKKTGDIYFKTLRVNKDTKLDYFENNGKVKHLSTFEDKKEYSLELENDKYSYSVSFKKNIIESFSIEYIGNAKGWDSYMETIDLRVKKTREILKYFDLNDDDNIFSWGKVIYSYDPRNKTPLISIYYL